MRIKKLKATQVARILSNVESLYGAVKGYKTLMELEKRNLI